MPDERTADAIAHWAPRFIAQGVDYNDFVRTTASLERWEQWLDAWVATGDMHTQQAVEAERWRRKLTAGEAYVRAALCYHFAKFVWLVDLAKRKVTAERAVRTLYAALSLLDPNAQRLEIPFSRVTMVGNLRRPSPAGRYPLVLLLPGLDSYERRVLPLGKRVSHARDGHAVAGRTGARRDRRTDVHQA